MTAPTPLEIADRLTYLESEARRFADFYPLGSDGSNTFVIFADKIASMRERPCTAMEDALVAHNDALRSAQQIASREGAETNWKSFRGVCAYTLAEHHETVNKARNIIKGEHDDHHTTD
jgi:hypothetical protein